MKISPTFLPPSLPCGEIFLGVLLRAHVGRGGGIEREEARTAVWVGVTALLLRLLICVPRLRKKERKKERRVLCSAGGGSRTEEELEAFGWFFWGQKGGESVCVCVEGVPLQPVIEEEDG